MKKIVRYIFALMFMLIVSFPVYAAKPTYVTCGPIKELPKKILR